MATKPDAAQTVPVWMCELRPCIDARVAPEVRAEVWRLLAPLPDQAPAADAAWLHRLPAALAAVPLPADLADALAERMKTILRERRWAELVGAVADAWPDRPEPLRDGLVLGRLEQLAREATREQSSAIRQVAIDDAPGVVLEAFANFDRTQPFNPWARRVLHNHAISRWRRECRYLADPDHLASLPSPPFSPPTEPKLVEALRAFRHLFDRAEFCPSRADGVDQYAALALDARLRLLDCLVNYGLDFLNEHFPLSGWERRRQVRPGWPTLGRLWGWAQERPPAVGMRRVEVVQRACEELTPELEVRELGPLWNQWINRAKERACRSFESHLEAVLFLHLFPQRSGAKGRECLS